MSAREILAGSAVVAVGVKDRMQKGLASMRRRLDGFGKSVSAIGRKLAAGGGILAGFSTAAFAPIMAAANHFKRLGDQMHKMSIRTGATTEFLSQMKFAAEQSGSSIEALEAGMFRANRRIANAATAGGPAVRALNELGLAAAELSQMTAEQRLDAIADSLAGMNNQARASQLGFEIFGGSFKDLQPLLAEGSNGMAKLRSEAAALGLTMSQDDANAAAAFGDAQNKLSKTASAAFRNIGAAVAPVLTQAIELVSKVVSVITNWINENRELFVSVLGIVAAVGAIAGILTTVGVTIAAAGIAVSGLAAAFGVLFSPIGAAIALVVGAGVAIYNFRTAIYNSLSFLHPFFEGIAATMTQFAGIATQTFAGIVEAIRSGDLAAAAAIALAGIKSAVMLGLAELGDFVEQWAGSIGAAMIAGRWDLAVAIAWENIKLVFVQGWNAVHAIFIGAQSIIGGAWDAFVLGLSSVWRTAYFGIAKGFVFVADSALKIIQKLEPIIRRFSSTLADGLASMSLDGVQNTLAQMEREALNRDQRSAQAKQKARDEQLAAALEADRKAEASAQNRIAAMEAEAAAAKAAALTLDERAAAEKQKLDQLVANASKEVAEQSTASPEKIDKLSEASKTGTLETKRASVKSSGTFSAAAAFALSAGSASERYASATAKNTAKVARLLQRQNKNIGKGGGLKIAGA